ncbi:lysophospholipid acyltransferase family protein [Balneolales bacterium ANBcel1]|nr:lysophospholipid acyltransferase family protein [Balneolales bacterium ANBcel1]
MIQAVNNRWARRVFNPYLSFLMRRHFSRFHMVNALPEWDRKAGLVVTPNHYSWWDGFFVDFVMRRYTNRGIRLMMLERQLARYSFFRYLGAFSINPDKPASLLQAVRYTRKQIADPRLLTVIYPQGEIEPYDKRPPNVKKGLRLFLGDAPEHVQVLVAATKIQYENERLPSVYFRSGALIPARNVVEDFRVFEHAFNENLDRLDEASRSAASMQDLLAR